MKRFILFLSILCFAGVSFGKDEMPTYFEKILDRPSEDFNKDKLNELINSKKVFSFPGSRIITVEEGQSIELADNKVRSLVNALKIELQSRLLSVYVDYEPYYKVTLKLKGNEPVPLWMDEILIDNYSSIGFEYGAKYNFQELNRIYSIAMQSVRAEFGDELQGSSVNTKYQTIDLEFYSENNKKSFTKNDLISRLGKYQSKEMQQFLDLPLNFLTLDRKPQNLVSRIYGGSHMNACTANFIWVLPINGSYGSVTSGHCPGFGQPGTQFWKDLETNSLFSITTRSEFFDSKRDFQWHTFDSSNVQYEIEIYTSSINTHQSHGIFGWLRRDDHWIGQKVCHYGKTSGNSCGEVDSINYNPGSNLCNGPCDPVYIKISHESTGSLDYPSLQCEGGDSGGPVYDSSNAAGVFKGSATSSTDSCVFAFYMAIDEIMDLNRSGAGSQPLTCNPGIDCNWDHD